MKTTLAMSALVASLFGSAQTWTPLNVGAASEVQFMSFPTNDTGYVSMGNGAIRKTTDGALTWTPCSLNTGAPVDIEFITGTRGFVINGNATAVLKTTDGAVTWSNAITNSNLTFIDICFANSAVGYVSATNSTLDTAFVYKTTDGGATWNVASSVSGPFNPMMPVMYFTSATTGFIAAESYTYKTIDGGLTWTQVYLNTNFDLIYSMHSPDGNNVFAAYLSSSFVTSTNGGDNWNQVSNTSYPGYGVYFTSATHGFTCGGNGIGSGVIEETNDGGITWTPAYLGNSFWSMDFPSPGVGYVGGTNGVIVKYSGPTSMTEPSDNVISCYPNPANEYLIIDNVTSGSQVVITNSLGQVVFHQVASDSRMRIDVSAFTNGIYSCQVISEGTRSVEQVIIQK